MTIQLYIFFGYRWLSSHSHIQWHSNQCITDGNIAAQPKNKIEIKRAKKKLICFNENRKYTSAQYCVYPIRCVSIAIYVLTKMCIINVFNANSMKFYGDVIALTTLYAGMSTICNWNVTSNLNILEYPERDMWKNLLFFKKKNKKI